MLKRFALMLLLGIAFITGCSKIEQPVTSPEGKVYAFVPEPVPVVGVVRGSGVSETAPDFRYLDADGKANSLGGLRGSPVVLNFWASWCPPCRAEMPLLEEVYRDKSWQDSGVVFLTVSIDETPSEARKFIAENCYTFPFLLDTRQAIGEAYNVYAIPTTFFIGKDGIIKARKAGAFTDKSELESGIKKISY